MHVHMNSTSHMECAHTVMGPRIALHSIANTHRLVCGFFVSGWSMSLFCFKRRFWGWYIVPAIVSSCLQVYVHDLCLFRWSLNEFTLGSVSIVSHVLSDTYGSQPDENRTFALHSVHVGNNLMKVSVFVQVAVHIIVMRCHDISLGHHVPVLIGVSSPALVPSRPHLVHHGKSSVW